MKDKKNMFKNFSAVSLILLAVLVLCACKPNTAAPQLTDIVANSPAKIYYTKGESLDLTGAQIVAKYSDDTTQNITLTSSHVSGYDKDVYGTQIVTVTYKEKTSTFAVIVADEIISNAEQFKTALTNQKDDQYWLITDDITLDSQAEIKKNITLDGNGKTIVFDMGQPLQNYDENTQSALAFKHTNAYVKNITVKYAEEFADWHSRYTVLAYFAPEEITFENVTLQNGDAGLYVNTSKVVLAGNINVSGNEFGGIEVMESPLATEDQFAELVVGEGVTITNITQTEAKPTIWVTGEKAIVSVPDGMFRAEENKGDNADKTFYFLLNN